MVCECVLGGKQIVSLVTMSYFYALWFLCFVVHPQILFFNVLYFTYFLFNMLLFSTLGSNSEDQQKGMHCQNFSQSESLVLPLNVRLIPVRRKIKPRILHLVLVEAKNSGLHIERNLGVSSSRLLKRRRRKRRRKKRRKVTLSLMKVNTLHQRKQTEFQRFFLKGFQNLFLFRQIKPWRRYCVAGFFILIFDCLNSFYSNYISQVLVVCPSLALFIKNSIESIRDVTQHTHSVLNRIPHWSKVHLRAAECSPVCLLRLNAGTDFAYNVL